MYPMQFSIRGLSPWNELALYACMHACMCALDKVSLFNYWRTFPYIIASHVHVSFCSSMTDEDERKLIDIHWFSLVRCRLLVFMHAPPTSLRCGCTHSSHGPSEIDFKFARKRKRKQLMQADWQGSKSRESLASSTFKVLKLKKAKRKWRTKANPSPPSLIKPPACIQ